MAEEQEEIRFVRTFSNCPRCNSELKQATAFSGAPSEFWLACSNPKCNTYVNTYIPQEHQASLHQDQHTIIGNFGGYGSGKTTTSREEFYKHMLITDKGLTLIGANVTSQYEQTIKKDIEDDIPLAFVKTVSAVKNYMVFKNGHRVLYRPLDDPEKLRSYNVSMFIILEGSECKPDAFVQLKSRLRNTRAAVQAKNDDGSLAYRFSEQGQPIPIWETLWMKGIVESNPDSGWIRKDIVLAADRIFKHGSVKDHILPTEPDPQISCHVTSTDANQFLPANFVELNSKGKSIWWINKYLYGSFLYAAGLVYPAAMRCVMEPVEIKPHWKRLVAFDYGLSDSSVWLFAAIDPENSKVYIYNELVCNNKNVAELSALYFQGAKDIPTGGLYRPPIIDPKSGPKRDYDKKSLADHFLDYGISFIPGAVSKDARVFRANTYMEMGYVKIFSNCTTLIEELRDYKFAKKPGDESARTNKPEDGKDHAISSLEWILMELPEDPRNLLYGVYTKTGLDLTKTEEQRKEIAYSEFVLKDPFDAKLESISDFVNFNLF